MFSGNNPLKFKLDFIFKKYSNFPFFHKENVQIKGTVSVTLNFGIVSNKQELRKGTVSGLPVPPAHYRFQSPYIGI